MDGFEILFLLFTFYSFTGWLGESIFCSIPAGKFINRGFLNGPFCPVYGVGGLLVVFALSPFRNSVFLLFLVAVLLTSVLEYLTGFAMEKLFRARYWDYSDHRFNLQGRVCLENSLIFGFLSVITVLYLHPAILSLIRRIPSPALPFLAGALMLYFAADTVLTVAETFRLNGKLDELQQVLDEIKEKAHTAKVETLEVLQETLASRMDESTRARLRSLYEKKDVLENGARLLQRRILRAFPTMRSVRSNESLQRMKEALQNRAKRIRKK